MRVLIAAGGTAGHINPALAIAGALKKADPTAEIHFAGRKEGMEYRLVGQAGYPFHHIEITGFQRRLSLNNIKRNIVTLWNLALSGPKAKAIMKEVKPDLVIGCGGYVSGPVVRCAAKMGIHTAIHEQNAFPGVTNKLLAPDVDLVFAAVPAAVEKLGAPDKTIVVGNPVRPEVFTKAKDRDAIRAELGAGDRTVILSFGGSLGARRVNEVVADLCAWEQHEKKPVLHLHATGQYGVQLFKDLEKEKNFAEGDGLVVKEYINNMPELLAAADLVISRAGALTLAIMVLPTILRTSEEALMSVSDSYREGSFGLGAGRLRTVFRIVLPSAVPGILAGIILAIGRICGETAALIYTSGTVAGIPDSVLDSGRTLAIHMYALFSEGLYMDEANATAVVLLIMVVLINSLSAFIAKRFGTKAQ